MWHFSLVSQRVFARHAGYVLEAAHDVIDETVGELGAHRRLLDLLPLDLEVLDDWSDGCALIIYFDISIFDDDANSFKVYSIQSKALT